MGKSNVNYHNELRNDKAHYDQKLEANAIGAIISNERVRDRIFSQLTPDCFYEQRNRRVFTSLLKTYMEQGLPKEENQIFSDLIRDEVITKQDAVAFFYTTTDPTDLCWRLNEYRNARVVQHASHIALDGLDLNPMSASEHISDIRRKLDEINPAAATGEKLWQWDELNEDDHPPDWIIPQLIDRDWVVMITGPNGGGKSTMCLQIALGAALGIHPWSAQPITQRKVLYIDAENSPGVIARKKRIANRMVEIAGKETVESIRFRFGTVNLADPSDRLRLEHHMQSYQPDLVVIGPIYKMYSSGSEDSWRSEAQAVQSWIDKTRRKYKFGTLIEGHPPKGDGNGQPKGDSSWGSWPYFGFQIALDSDDRRLADLTPWRYPREPIIMPSRVGWGFDTALENSRKLMWAPVGTLLSSEDW